METTAKWQPCISAGDKAPLRGTGVAVFIRIGLLTAQEQDLGKATWEQRAHAGHVAEAGLYLGRHC